MQDFAQSLSLGVVGVVVVVVEVAYAEVSTKAKELPTSVQPYRLLTSAGVR